MSGGLYIHIPFCEQHCHYCAFAVSLDPSPTYALYVDRLVRELDMARPHRAPQTLYLGGGTPSLLDASLVRRVVEAVDPGAGEITIEANPGTLDREKLEGWAALGISRVSLGAQSFDEADLERAGRLHSPADIVRDYEHLGRMGFANINLDLIAGLPGQSRRRWLDNLEWIERLSPEHVSIYLLEREDSTVWANQPAAPGADEEQAWFYQAAADRLGEIGYVHYEVSNWARPGYECAHNRGYWNGTPYRGVGLGAHSFLDDERFWNSRSMSRWAAAIDGGVLPVEGSERCVPATRLQEAFLLGLRQMSGFDVRVIARELGFQYPQDWFDRVDALRSAGLVEFDGSVLRLSAAGWLLTSSITEELLCPSLLSICEAIP